ncbi:MAG: nucleotidyl transferase AbiEii/AbiGii toxin family protein [Fibrobacterota bacterium]
MKKETAYATAAALRQALEARLNKQAKEQNLDVMQLRRHAAFDRLLVRIFSVDQKDLFVLKGGYALELRLHKARTTRDVDICLNATVRKNDPGDLRLKENLQKAIEKDPGDFFQYTIGESTLDLVNAPYGGNRFPVACRLASRTFAEFSIDIAAGDVWLTPHETVQGGDWLGFAGIPALSLPVISAEQQFAEKLHSYTLPRQSINSRAKDLIDMLLLIDKSQLDNSRVKDAVKKTFQRRKTHAIPKTLQNPPDSWATSFSEMAKETGLQDDLDSAIQKVRKFCAETIK